MKLFAVRLNAIHTFGLCINQFLTASNIDFPDTLKTPSVSFSNLVYQTIEDWAGSGTPEG